MFTAGIAGDVADYAVFPLVVGRPWSRSSSTTLACFWLVLLVTLQLALFPSFVGMSTWRSSPSTGFSRVLQRRPSVSLVLLVTMHFALCSLRCRHVRGRALHRLCQWHVLGWVLWVTFHPRCVPCCRLQARDARHHGRFYTISRGLRLAWFDSGYMHCVSLWSGSISCFST